MELSTKHIVVAGVAAVVVLGAGWLLGSASSSNKGATAREGTVFVAPPRTPDLSGEVMAQLEGARPPEMRQPEAPPLPPLPSSSQAAPDANLIAQIQDAVAKGQADAKALEHEAVTPEDDPVMEQLMRYGTPVSKQLLPVGGLTLWTLVSQTGKTVRLYTTADGQALVAGTVWNLANGQNLTEAAMRPPAPGALGENYAAYLPQVVNAPLPQSNLIGGGGQALPAAFDGAAPSEIPEAIRLVDELAGYKEGTGGPADTLYVIIDPRCPYCRRAYQNTREYVKNGATIKWIPTVALGRPEQGVPLATTVLRAPDPDTVARVLGGHEQIATQPNEAEMQQLDNNLDFMMEAFRQNNETNPGVPVAFFVDRRSGRARMMTGVSERVVIEDILGKVKK